MRAMKRGPFILVLTLLLPAVAGPVMAGEAADYLSPPSFSKSLAARGLDLVELRTVPAVDSAVLRAAAEANDAKPGPFIFAHPIAVDFDLANSGTWETLDDGSRLWRLRIRSATALHLNLALTRFDLPARAQLWIYNAAGDQVHGPYSTEDRNADGQLWTPIVYGSEAVVELYLPWGVAGADVGIGRVHHGFRYFGEKQGSCNIDVVCPEAEPWQDQTRAGAWYSLQGFGTCSGQLVNNTAQDGTPYFLTANHCGIDEGNAPTMVFYFNYRSPVCGQLNGGDLSDNLSGAQFVAAHPEADFALVVLDQSPPPEFDVYYDGWNVDDSLFKDGKQDGTTVCVHFPNLDEQAISFNEDPLAQVDVFLDEGLEVSTWQVDAWELGTTEPGSSGSCLFYDSSCIGVLSGGGASCSSPELSDYFARLGPAWEGGGTPATRLRDHLDPLGLGVTMLPGMNPGAGGCIPSPTTLCLRGRRFKVEVSRLEDGVSVPAQSAVRPSGESGVFYFFNPQNWEVVVKVLDGCDYNGQFWLFAAGATSIDWSVTVEDTLASESRTWMGGPRVIDTSAFATCP